MATIVLERSTAAAQTTEIHYRAVYKALGGSSGGLLSRTANAVIAFGSRPSAKEREAVARCVRPTR